MAQELSKTKKRIESISSTLKITKAMELVATAKLKKWKDKLENSNLYLQKMQDIISMCFSDDEDNIEFKKFQSEKTLFVVVTSSLGLCGGYNYNIFKFLNDKIKEDDKVIILGTKGLVKLNNDNIETNDQYVDILDNFNYSSVEKLKEYILNEYKKGIYKEVKLIVTTYKNSLTFIPQEIKILPLGNIQKKEVYDEPIYEPNKKELFALLLPKYLNTLLYDKLLEAIVCEHASRRNSMDSASDNAEELQDKLMLEFNKARQQAITQEITEVVSGASNV